MRVSTMAIFTSRPARMAATMKKMRSISDMEFSRLDLKPYLQDVVAK